MENNNSSSRGGSSIFEALPPKHMFIFGLVGGLMTLCTIGFFILLGIVLSGDSSVLAKGNNAGYVAPVGDQPADPSVPNQPTQITVRPVDEKNEHVRGAKNAKLTIVEYSDFECPFCKRFHATMQEVVQKYNKDVRWVYRHFPLDSLHSQARTEALASECASEQGKFWEFADKIYEVTASNDGLDLSKLQEYATQAGVKDLKKFQSCLDTKKYASKVQADEQDAQKAGGQGTPYSVLLGPNGETIPISGAQPLSAIDATIQQFLK